MAKVKQCGQCKAEIPKDAKKCMYCGSKQRKEVGLGAVLIVLALALILISNIGSKSEPKAPTKAPERIQAEAKAAADQRAAYEKSIHDEFRQRRDSVIANVKDMINKGDFSGAKKLANKYRIVGDPELIALSNQAHEKDLLARVKKVPVADTEKNRNIYSQLAGLDPDNQTYKKKLAHYQGILDRQEAERVARKIAFGDPPVRSAWDGSYREVERYLERAAHDPDSIDIEKCTEVFHTKKGWLVGCVYRGKNAFGGKVVNSNWFTIVQGMVVKMEPADRYQW